LKGVKRNSGGDYIVSSLSKAVDRDAIVSGAVAEALRIIEAEKRKSTVFFCVDIAHCKHVSKELRKWGVIAPVVTGKTKQVERDQIAENFKAGRIKAVCNVNVYTEGFNAQCIDCIVLLRPTLSPGLFSQMVGRGLRVSAGKRDCLVLDFANCIEEHGPIDLLGGQRTIIAVCKKCREAFSRAVGQCPACGWEIPIIEVERLGEQEAAERRLHGKKASKRSILSGEPQTLKVDAVFATRHIKEGSPDSLKVQYRCGLRMFREWVCLDHEGYAGQKAQSWWRKRFSMKNRNDRRSLSEALSNMFLTSELLDWTKTVTVRKSGKFYEIIGYNKPIEGKNEIEINAPVRTGLRGTRLDDIPVNSGAEGSAY
jgi:DNA repair protein RadD